MIPSNGCGSSSQEEQIPPCSHSCVSHHGTGLMLVVVSSNRKPGGVTVDGSCVLNKQQSPHTGASHSTLQNWHTNTAGECFEYFIGVITKRKKPLKQGRNCPFSVTSLLASSAPGDFDGCGAEKSRGDEQVLLQPSPQASATYDESQAWEQSPPSGVPVPDSWMLWEADTCLGLGDCQLFDAAALTKPDCKACGGGKEWRSP